MTYKSIIGKDINVMIENLIGLELKAKEEAKRKENKSMKSKLTKQRISNLLTALTYEAWDSGEVDRLNAMESELETTKDLEGYIRKHDIKNLFQIWN